MEKKQSSVEWIHSKILLRIGLDDTDIVELRNIIEQAKEMHKEEIEFSYNCGWADGHDEATDENPLFTIGEQYYNETFGGNNE